MGHGCRDLASRPGDLAHTIQDGKDTAKYVIRSGLDTTDCLDRAVKTSVVLQCHAWMRSTGFSDVQASLMDIA